MSHGKTLGPYDSWWQSSTGLFKELKYFQFVTPLQFSTFLTEVKNSACWTQVCDNLTSKPKGHLSIHLSIALSCSLNMCFPNPRPKVACENYTLGINMSKHIAMLPRICQCNQCGSVYINSSVNNWNVCHVLWCETIFPSQLSLNLLHLPVFDKLRQFWQNHGLYRQKFLKMSESLLALEEKGWNEWEYVCGYLYALVSYYWGFSKLQIIRWQQRLFTPNVNSQRMAEWLADRHTLVISLYSAGLSALL